MGGVTGHGDWEFRWSAAASPPATPNPRIQSQGMVASVPPDELIAPAYVIQVVASHRHQPLRQTARLTVAIQRPPTFDLPSKAPLEARPLDGAAVRLSTAAAHWRSPDPSAGPLQYRFMVRAPEGLLLPLSHAPNFTRSPDVQVPWPWLPGPAPAPSTFALYVRDARGAEAGPYFATAAPPLEGGRCTVACAAPPSLLQAVACRLCDGPAPAAYHPAPDLLRWLRAFPASAGAEARLALLQQSAVLGLRFADVEGRGFAVEAAVEAFHLLLNATAPLLAADPPAALLLRALSGLARHSPPLVVSELIDALLHEARDRRDPCTFEALDLRAGPLQGSMRRLPVALPAPVTVTLPARDVSVRLPAALAGPLRRAATAGAADLFVTAAPAATPLVTAVVTVAVEDPVAGTPVPVRALLDPITIAFRDAPPAPAGAPAADSFECVATERGPWEPDGLWLRPAAPAPGLACETTHLTAFAVRQRVWVDAVRGCLNDAAPRTLFCHRAVPPLTIAGVHFGAAGARVTLSAARSGAVVPCPVVRHRPGAEDVELRCEGAVLPTNATEPEWFDLTVTARHGTAFTLPQALLSQGVPTLAALRPLGRGPAHCAAAGARALVQCPRAGVSFGLAGRFHLNVPSANVTVRVGAHHCPMVVLVNASYIECRGFSAGADALEPLPVVVTVSNVSSPRSPVFTLSLAGVCSYKAGFWAGLACLHCQPGFHGPDCALPCPGLAPGAVCGGHGTCDDGTAGSGRCTCSHSPETGMWAGEDCTACQARFYGPRCRDPCPTARAGAPGDGLVCGGHGTCDGGRTGTGRCACAVPFAGVACDMQCPGLEGLGVVCSGHGDCVAGPAVTHGSCRCHAGPAQGYWGGAGCSRCADGWVGPNCTTQCPRSEGPVCSGHGTCVVAQGRAACVCLTSHAGPVCAARCPVNDAQLPCSGHGECAVDVRGDVRCRCAARWAGAACDACAAGWAGAACRAPCPANGTGHVCGGHGACEAPGVCRCAGGYCGPGCAVAPAACAAAAACPLGAWGPACAGACACGAHGTCVDGALGDGRCVCAEGWVGAACAVPCEGGTVPACSGHGQCGGPAGACECDQAWGTDPGSGVACSRPCPANALGPCSGHGNCTRDAQCVCDAGYGGPACATACPMDAAGARCGGRGACAADGTCACDAPWGGRTCDACAKGYWGPQCARRCGHGTTVGRQCVCDRRWGALDCSKHCPEGELGLVCSGHGVCDSGWAGAGVCLCLDGYAGPACGLRCPGGAEQPCSGHGTCDRATGECRCLDGAAGHWAGALCDECQTPFSGPDCDLLCPRDAAGVACGGHGRCLGASLCTCFADAARGYWAGPVCGECAPGRFGAACTAECLGGHCAQCSGHGACRDGAAGAGDCVCDAGAGTGFWAGANCSECQEGYWGPQCDQPCPGGAGAACGAHGVCEDGLYGTGQCVCAEGEGSGWWAGPACERCRGGFYGADCAAACPDDGAGAPCAGHGRCDDGVRGTGACACDAGYTGAACHLLCPVLDGAVCRGHGGCGARGGRATCNCSAAAVGHWAGEACGSCVVGWTGPLCTLRCPTNAEGWVCSGHGVCGAPPSGTDPVCACYSGYAGLLCETECPGGHLQPCMGHGACDPATGRCACAASPAAGYWTGADCGACQSGWSGRGCLFRCPVGADGQPCSGFPCVNGQCLCDALTCGRGCNLTGTPCDQTACPTGWYGAECAARCPTGPRGVCNGAGQCLARVYATGVCLCDAGYAGGTCEVACAVGPHGVCSGHGACSAVAGGCACLAGYAAADCATECPRGARGLYCAGHGVCSDGAEGDGTCHCAAGYGTADCSVSCPGYDPYKTVWHPCGAHGVCVPATAQCLCDQEQGHWGGELCEDCASGWFGPECGGVCVHGTTVGRACVCLPGFATANCSVRCPGVDGSCSGHGRCRDTHAGDGACACADGWYGPACGVQCRPHLCFPAALYPPARAVCEPATGACACQRNASGHWAGPHCNECEPGYWGPACRLHCACSGHGACGQVDGDCTCFRDAARGYWAGRYCDRCAAGFLDPDCTVANMGISRSFNIRAPARRWDAAGSAALVVDEAHHLMYLCGMPLLVIHADTGATTATVELGGMARAGALAAAVVVLLVEAPGTGAVRVVQVRRGPAPAVVRQWPVPRWALAAQHRRRFQPLGQAAGYAPRLMQAFLVGATQYLVLLQAAEVAVLQQPAVATGSAPPEPVRLPLGALGLDEVRTAAMWDCRGACGGNATALLLLAGARGAQWRVVAIPCPIAGAAPPRVHHLSDRVRVRGCDGGRPCVRAEGLAVHAATLYVGLQHAPGLRLAAIELGPWFSAGPRVRRSVALGDEGDVLSLFLDPLTSALFAAVALPKRPSIVYKLRAPALELYGLVRLGIRGGMPEVAVHLAPAPVALRRLFVLSLVRGEPTVIPLLLAAVAAVEPTLADAAGGALIDVRGEGFVAPFQCAIAGATAPGTVVNATTLRCRAPALAVSGGCHGDAVEVAMQERVVTDNGVALRRVATPVISALNVSRGYHARPQAVLLTGHGFVASAYVACKFYARNFSAVVSGPGNVAVLSATSMICRQPALPTPLPAPSYLGISVDGQVRLRPCLCQCPIPRAYLEYWKIKGGSPKTPSPPPKTRVTIVGKNGIFKREHLVRPFLVRKLLGPRPPPPPLKPSTLRPVLISVQGNGLTKERGG